MGRMLMVVLVLLLLLLAGRRGSSRRGVTESAARPELRMLRDGLWLCDSRGILYERACVGVRSCDGLLERRGANPDAASVIILTPLRLSLTMRGVQERICIYTALY